VGFLAPGALALAAIVPVIVAMYLLKLRRTEQAVSSLYLWRRMVRDLEANAPWQRLRRNLLLILQLLFLGALILALARPFTWGSEASSGQVVILILDTSASMSAIDVPPSRLESAKALARQWVDSQPNSTRFTLITAGAGAQVLVASSQDRHQVHRALDGIQATAGGGDLAAAIELASAVAARQPDSLIVVLSDGRVSLPERLAVKGRLRYVPVGQSGQNQAISAMSLEPNAGGESSIAFVQVNNYGDAPARRRLDLYADGQLVNAFDLEIAPGDQSTVIADALPQGTQVVEAQLLGQDVLPLDDIAWAVYNDSGPTAVTLITEGNLFLETALSLLPGLQVTTVRPADLEEGWGDGQLSEGLPEGGDLLPQLSGPTDSMVSRLIIFDAYVPVAASLPSGNLLYIAPPRSTQYFTVTGTVEQPVPRPVDPEDPLLSHVNLAEVGILDAAHISLPDWARPVIVGYAGSEAVPLLLSGERDGRRIAVLAYDLRRTDMPLQVAFPLLLANLTAWLAPGSVGGLPTQVAPGAGVSLSVPPGIEEVGVTRPDGTGVSLVPGTGQLVFADTAKLGVYEIAWGQAERARFAVNFFSPQESQVQPAQVLPGLASGGDPRDESPQAARREWWRPLALVALALLAVEWLLYQRASVARLWGETRQLVRGKT